MKHRQSLWQSNIDSLSAFKDISRPAFVAIDVEGYRGKGETVTEIGIAVLPPRAQFLDTANHGLEAFFNQNSIQSYSFRIQGRKRREKGRDVYRFRHVQHIKLEEIEVVLASLFASLEGQFQNLVLVGFDLSSEFAFIASYLQGITPFILSWVDLQELAAEISNTPSPGMRDTLLALGFACDGLFVQYKGNLHSAGNDAVRELVILVKILALPESDLPLQIHRVSSQSSRQENSKRPLPGMRKCWKGRPEPKEIYPFIATICIPGGLLTSIFKDMGRMYRIFVEYEPTADEMVKNGTYGWVCLPSADILAQFIREVDGQEVGGGCWKVTTDYDPDGSPMVALTPAQLRAAKRAAQDAQIDGKQQQRRLKQNETEDDCLDLDVAIAAIEGIKQALGQKTTKTLAVAY